MPETDHLVLVAPSLEEGVRHVRERLGLEMPFGGAHPEMGTHNHLLRLGDGVFLEVIAVDPQAPPPAGPRWFGLGRPEAVRADWEAGRRLRGWVARTGALDTLLARHGGVLGRATAVSRGDRRWRFAVPEDGRLPGDGALPCVIDWGPRGTPAPAMPELGARLVSFEVEHPDPAGISAMLAAMELREPPAVRAGRAARLRAVIETAGGVRVLD